ncbi:putative KAP-like P-loop ATPase [Flavobacterium sp. W4I14]|nr:putative KAP-like P-loop ATPase [Flavobacterium sp. W4I14]
MITNLSANREIQDYKTEDSFDFIIKADAIKSFLETNVNSLLHNKMLALYGNWGSGKTSLMRHIEKEIDKGIYFPIFFEAWAHEKDDNLALSLCDALTSEITEGNLSIIKSFRKNAIALLKGFTSGVSVKISDPISKGFEFAFEGKDAVEAFDKALEDRSEKSFFTENKDFKKTFLAIEELILKKKKATRIIVFVDDLDRCEPENVLNLITAIKLFFTYGQKTVFLAGLDKDAITKAVITKYKDVVKSEEYLEKVFDISFSMPKTFSLAKFLSQYFTDHIELLEDFFKSIGLTNPRHIKKILNKYEILNTFKISASIPQEIRSFIPNVIFRQEYQNGNIWETILCIYFIILYENHADQFEELEQYEEKFAKLLDPIVKLQRETVTNTRVTPATASDVLKNFKIQNIRSAKIAEVSGRTVTSGGKRISFVKFLLIFSHSHPNNFAEVYDERISQYESYYTDSGILTSFCRFLIKHKDEIENNEFSDYIFWNYFNMAKYLL